MLQPRRLTVTEDIQVFTRCVLPTGLLANDVDVDGDPLHAVLVNAPSHGSLTLNADGSFIYSPAAGFAGQDTFDYRVSDGVLDDLSSVTLDIHSVNNPPEAFDATYTAVHDRLLTLAARDFLTNAYDPMATCSR